MLPNLSQNIKTAIIQGKREPLFTIASWITLLFPLLMISSGAEDTAMSVIAIIFIAHSFLKKDWAWCRQAWFLCLMLLWVYITVRGCFAENPTEALRRSLPFGRYFIFAAALANWTLVDTNTRNFFIKILTVVIIFLAADGLLQWCLGTDILFHDIISQPDGSGLRLTGPFKAAILGIIMTWLAFPVCMNFVLNDQGRFINDKRLPERVCATILIIIVIALSGERMALLLTLFGCVIIVFMLKVRKIYLLALFAAGFFLLEAIAFASPRIMDRQILSTIDTLENWQQSRYGELLTSDLRVAEINPVFGIGSNHFRIVCPTLYPGAPKEKLEMLCNIHPHNIYLEWFIEQGVIGFGLFIGFIAAIFYICVMHWKTARNNPLFLGFFIAFIIKLWPLASSTGFYSRWGAPPFWLILGALLFYARQHTKKPSGIN